MDLEDLIRGMGTPGAYPGGAGTVEVRQTHISVVFLTERHAYKVKKPLKLDFVDYGSLERRRFFCEEEVRLNRRLARGVYLGVVPVSRREGGRLEVEGTGQVVEWAVKMKRLPEEATLLWACEHDRLEADALTEVAGRLARFHAGAERGPSIAGFGRFEVISRNARENLERAQVEVGRTISQAVYERLVAATERALEEHEACFEARAERGVPRDTHGDLRLEHVYLFPEEEEEDRITIVDCVEFNERFRYADPVADASFLSMDLAVRGRRDLAGAFARAYAESSGDEEGLSLWAFYTSYRAAVRAKVASLLLEEPELPEAQRTAAVGKARARWLLALGEVEGPRERPGVVLVMGGPGTGKSTLARGLAEAAGFRVLRSDEVRKELAGFEPSQSAAEEYGRGIYSPEWSARTYGACLERMRELLLEGERVVVDATFSREEWRRAFVEEAQGLGVPVVAASL